MDRSTTTDIDYSSFQNSFGKVLVKLAPIQRFYARANDRSFMKRVLLKAIMLPSRLKNKYNKSRTAKDWEAF